MNRPIFMFRPNLRNSEHRKAWKILQNVPEGQKNAFLVQAILETLVPGLNMLYLVTEREQQFEEQAEELFDSQGLIVAMTKPGTENPSGNLILDLHDWEMHLDIIS